MIVVANRIPVAEGYEAQFEERFAQRAGRVEDRPGFVRMEVLRPVEGDTYVVLTHWESMEDFEAWTESQAFEDAHSGDGPPREMFSGKNEMEMHEVFVHEEA